MCHDANDILRKILVDHLNNEQIEGLINTDTFITLTDSYQICHPDILRNSLQKIFISDLRLGERESIILSDRIVENAIPEIRKLGFCIIDNWAVKPEKKSCSGCPAYQWVIHRVGTHPCHLGVDIVEEKYGDEWRASPTRECLRPQDVGVSYLIAREFNLPEPIVGKMNAWQYDQYCKERERYATEG